MITMKYFVTTANELFFLEVVVANNFFLIILEYPGRRLSSLAVNMVLRESKN